jgi:predicted Rossmann fold nucleotide-binding protein DprA/Smf involved in DNA uptake
MDIFLTDDTKAILLLCGVLGKKDATKPLTLSEYNRLAHWLRRENMRPAILLSGVDLKEVALETGMEHERLQRLLDRGVQLGFAIEEWQRNGLWIVSRSDQEYPTRYKTHLKEKAPPLLFGAGDKILLQGGGIAIVGSRNVDIEGEDFTRAVAEECAYCRMPVVSGGARGVDQIAMRTALQSGGKTIGVLAENLLKASIERHARHAIAEGQLLLISPYHPQARFTVGTAMGRNKLIYAMANYGLVVSAEHKKGGTWAGAEEELKRQRPIPVFVRTTGNVPLGNEKLLDLGAMQWPTMTAQGILPETLAEVVANRGKDVNLIPENLNLFSDQPQEMKQDNEPADDQQQVVTATVPALQEEGFVEPAKPVSVYEAVLPVLLANLGSPVTADELAEKLDVAKGQLNIWLKKAVKENLVKKHRKPVRYSVRGGNTCNR